MRGFLEALLRKALARAGLRVIPAAQQQLLEDLRGLMPLAGPGRDYLPARQIGHAGFDLNVAGQLAFLERMSSPACRELFALLRDDPEINPGRPAGDEEARGPIHNGFYPTPDAEIYAAMIAEHRPTRIVEVGSGYSTVIARRAAQHLGIGCEIHVIDPQPRRAVAGFATRVEPVPVQASTIRELLSEAGQRVLLFVDSSHVTKLGGDVPYLFCRVLPDLASPLRLHVHDVFTPYDYPLNYGLRFYTEQYVLQAWLAGNPRLSVLFAAHFMSRAFPARMQAAFGPEVARDPLFFGASFWIDMAAA